LRASTVNSYLAGVRQMHIMLGLEPPNLRSSLVKLILKGPKLEIFGSWVFTQFRPGWVAD
jgi:hypothetical protein